MFLPSVLLRSAGCRLALAAFLTVAVAMLAVTPAIADGPVVQSSPFYWADDDTQVASRNGEPVDAFLYRFANQRSAIEWQLMTQGLTPGAWYKIWLGDVWVGTARATPRGDLNAFGHYWTNAPYAPLMLVITTVDGDPVQYANFLD